DSESQTSRSLLPGLEQSQEADSNPIPLEREPGINSTNYDASNPFITAQHPLPSTALDSIETLNSGWSIPFTPEPRLVGKGGKTDPRYLEQYRKKKVVERSSSKPPGKPPKRSEQTYRERQGVFTATASGLATPHPRVPESSGQVKSTAQPAGKEERYSDRIRFRQGATLEWMERSQTAASVTPATFASKEPMEPKVAFGVKSVKRNPKKATAPARNTAKSVRYEEKSTPQEKETPRNVETADRPDGSPEGRPNNSRSTTMAQTPLPEASSMSKIKKSTKPITKPALKPKVKSEDAKTKLVGNGNVGSSQDDETRKTGINT
ncbi:hypothetical protein HDU67_006030, partial [Dinochytrium kinnereticum]